MSHWLCVAWLLAAPLGEPAEDAYFVAPLSSLRWSDGATLAPHAELAEWRGGLVRPFLGPYLVLEGPGEACIAPPSDTFNESFALDAHTARIAIRVPAGTAVRGTLFAPEESDTAASYFGEPGFELDAAPGFQALAFEIPAGEFRASQEDFLRARLAHDERLLRLTAPGSAWWRMRIDEAKRLLAPEELPAEDPDAALLDRWTRTDVDDTFELFSGGRALAENLQLDRMILPGPGGPADVELASLPGIQTAAFDWKARVAGLDPALDPLAHAIPEDQHGLFFPSFEAFLAVLAEGERQGAQWYQIAEPSSEDLDVRGRYERQMCLPLGGLAETLGPVAIRSLALTGSDPFLRTGTDLAVVFESAVPGLLVEFVASEQQRSVAAQTAPSSRAEHGSFDLGEGQDPVEWRAALSADDALRSYVARVGDTVAVSNSLPQLERVVRACAGSQASLARSDEYAFFRARYPRGEGESAFLILTDATIRRWCSPRWRIGMARRTQAAAWLADLEARRLHCQSRGLPVTHESLGESGLTEFGFIGEDSLIHSPTWGSTRFLRPILELDLERVTAAERDAYERYRVRYQSRWSQFFDPIALSLSVEPGAVEGDLTVLPLIGGSEYNDLREWCGSTVLRGPAYRPAGSIGHFAIALDPENRYLREVGGMLASFGEETGAISMGWLDGRLELFAEDDPFWSEYQAAEAADEADVFLEENFTRLPLVVALPSKDPMRLAALLAALRTTSASAAPGLLTWETREHQGSPYVCIQPAEGADLGFGQVQLCYAALPQVFLATLREDLLQRALERIALASSAPDGAGGTPGAPTGNPSGVWFAGSACLEFTPRLPLFLFDFAEQHFMESALANSWSALPILNELERAFPDRDPQELYAQAFGAGSLASGPDGGAAYAWNAQWSSFESTQYGLPAAPRQGPTLKDVLASIERLALGITFEQDGLRARARLERTPH